MAANHPAACARACTLWKGDACQQPKVAWLSDLDPALCVRPLRDTLTLASRGKG
jgi:hypothetical protein